MSYDIRVWAYMIHEAQAAPEKSCHVSRQPHRKKAGFTLLELTIALAIIMIVSSGIFLVARQSERRALQNASLMLQADLRYVQRRTMIEGRRFRVRFDRVNNLYEIRLLNESIRTVYLPRGVRLQHYSNGNHVEYLPRGTPANPNTITLQTARYRQQVAVVVSGGRARITDIQELVN